jgi:uncharacterized protein (DUF2267 family)
MATLEEAKEIIDDLPQWIAGIQNDGQPTHTTGADPKKVNAFLLRLCHQIIVTPDGQVTALLKE